MHSGGEGSLPVGVSMCLSVLTQNGEPCRNEVRAPHLRCHLHGGIATVRQHLGTASAVASVPGTVDHETLLAGNAAATGGLVHTDGANRFAWDHTVDATPADLLATTFGRNWQENHQLYENSPLLKLKILSSRAKGKEFERIVEWQLTQFGHKVERSGTSDFDRFVDEKRVEIKGSFLWGDGEFFRWQQIRLDQQYDHIIFVAAYPERIEYYTATHAEASEALRVQDEKGRYRHNQHGGNSVDSGVYFVDGLPEDIPWMHPLSRDFPVLSESA